MLKMKTHSANFSSPTGLTLDSTLFRPKSFPHYSEGSHKHNVLKLIFLKNNMHTQDHCEHTQCIETKELCTGMHLSLP